MEIELRGVSKSFGQKSVLRKIDIVIRDGELFGLLGSSGCGKTTLLRIISGLETPDSGAVLYDGQDVTSSTPRDRKLGFVFQNFALYPNRRVFDNIAYPLKLQRLPSAVIKTQVVEMARSLQIADLLDRYPEKLSGGEAQRVALARCLVKQAAAHLFDEPLSNIDAVQRLRIRDQLRAVQRQDKRTCIYVTHDREDLAALSDRIAVMGQGVIEQVGTLEEIIKQPVSECVATLIASPNINLLSVTRDDVSGAISIAGVPLDPNLRAAHWLRRALGTQTARARCTLGFWPATLRYKEQCDDLAFPLAGIVESVRFAEPLHHVHVRVGECLVHLTTLEPPPIRSGNIQVAAPVTSCMLFVEGRNVTPV